MPTISVFAPNAIVATAFCIALWGYLMIRNFIDFRILLSIACFLSTFAYICAFIQYIIIFYIDRTPQKDSAMWWLFVRMLAQCGAVIIFTYAYKYTKYRNTDIDGYFRKN